MNIQGYNLILGTPFIFQHQVTLGLNPTRVVIGSSDPKPLQDGDISMLSSYSMSLLEDRVNDVRKELLQLAEPLCQKASETALPPLRRINHKIPLKDETETYPFRPSRIAEAFRPQWNEKKQEYLASKRWEVSRGVNSSPMLFLKKPGPPGSAMRMRTVCDLRNRNKNTIKRASPLPSMDSLISCVAAKRYRSVIDGKDAYEQIRIEPRDVSKTLMATPDGTMISNVMQQGDCNAISTFMAVMQDIFSEHLGKFMSVYLDDIFIYTDTLEDHKRAFKTILDLLKKNKFYLAKDKLQILPRELKILGHVVTDDGIKMDPVKVDSISKWKTPTNKDLLRGFLGAVGYLADNVEGVCILMAALTRLTGDTVPFQWGITEQQSFNEIKILIEKHRNHNQITLNYTQESPQINLVTDGCCTGVAGKISQGNNWRTAPVVAFFSAKLNNAQQNYSTGKIELLASLETMMKYKQYLHRVHFKWYTNHKPLIYLLRQSTLSLRQSRWMAKLSNFDFEVIYVPGDDNKFVDALLRIYSDNAPGTVCAPLEYVEHNDTMVISS
ncbi:MAG: reverse transcriptase [Rhizonema sp. PD38]|nr:reverse transcriptase [Rhizonema sp. PD38]